MNSGGQGGYQNSRGDNRPAVNSVPATAVTYPDLGDKELLGEPAAKLAEFVVNASRNESNELTSTQVRRFYSEVKSIERCLHDVDAGLSDELYGRIKLIKAKAAYSTARKSNKLPRAFANFLGYYIDRVKLADGPTTAAGCFIRFCRLFEAFVGYSSPTLKNQ